MASQSSTRGAPAVLPSRSQSVTALPPQRLEVAGLRSHSLPIQSCSASRQTIVETNPTTLTPGAEALVSTMENETVNCTEASELEILSVRKIEKPPERVPANKDKGSGKRKDSSPNKAQSKRPRVKAVAVGEGSDAVGLPRDTALFSIPELDRTQEAAMVEEQPRSAGTYLSMTNLPRKMPSDEHDTISRTQVGRNSASNEKEHTGDGGKGKQWSARTWTANQYHMMGKEAYNHFPFRKFREEYGKSKEEVFDVWSVVISLPILAQASRVAGEARGGLGEQRMKEQRAKNHAMLAELKAEAAAADEVLNKRKIEAYVKAKMEADEKKAKTADKKPKTLAEALEQMEAANKASAKALKVYEKLKDKEEKKAKAGNESGGAGDGAPKKKRATKTSALSKG